MPRAVLPRSPAVVLVCCLGCAVPAAPPVAAAPAPAPSSTPASDGTLITVTFVDAVVGLSHDDGLAWDSPHIVPELTRAGLRVARSSSDGYSRVIDVLAANDAQPWGKPDPTGAVTLMASPSCNRETRLLPSQRDTYRPSWAPGVVFHHVKLDHATRFRLVLEDDDAPRPSELIGVVDIAYAALEDALAKDGAVHRVDVGEQGSPIYYVGLRVTRE